MHFTSVKFSKTEDWLAVADGDGNIRIYDTETRRIIRRFKG